MEPVPDSTAETVTRAQRGDDAAFEQLVREFDRGLRASAIGCWGRAGRRTCCKRVSPGLSRPCRSTAPSSGHFKLAVPNHLSLMPRRAAAGAAPAAAVGVRPRELPFANESEPDVAARDSLWRALGTLSSEERACVVLVDGLGFDYESAATILDVPRGTIASRLNHARPLLRRALREPLDETEGEGHARIPR